MNFDKLKGIIVGVALGDALGAPHEFKHQTVKYTGNLEHPVRLWNRFQGESFLPIGSVSDDTQMTLIVLKHLINNKEYDPQKIVLEYEKWVRTSSSAGKNTRELFKGVTTFKGYLNRYTKKFDNTDPKDWTQSNGSLMRCSPFILSSDKDLLTDTKLTNPHPNNIESSKIYMHVLKNLAYYGNPPDLKELRNQTLEKSVMQVILDVENKIVRKISDRSVKGWVCTALYCALYSIYHIPSLSEALDYFIPQKGDTDTNAAILGALYGARDGFNKIYSENKENIEIVLKNNELQGLDELINNYFSLT